jgi:predicted enzyme related to lactoylglutathione lyase
VLITQDNGEKGADRPRGEGFSLRVTTAQNIDDLAARIKERGGTLATEPFDAFGGRAFRIVDPDGFRFAISSERK